MIGRTLAHYEITGLLGKGGMGEVYRARDTRLDRDVALKILPPTLAADPTRLERFQREAKTVAGLSHPNIVHMYSVEEDGEVRFLTMELVEGRELGDLLSRGGLALSRVLEVGLAVADALAEAHAKGVIHRDLKPANVMVTGEGRTKILDFGLAKLAQDEPTTGDDATRALEITRQGTVLGTGPYMSPEQIRGQEVDRRTDLFSLGVLLYELSSGQQPFVGETVADVTTSILRDVPVDLSSHRPGLPRRLVEIVHRCLEKDRDHRPESARAVAEELRTLREQSMSGSGERAPVGPKSGNGGGSRRGRLVAAAVFLLLLVASIALWSSSQRIVSPESGAKRPIVAVLPFENLGDEDDEYFADGITDEITSRLALIDGLGVISRTSARLYENTEKTIPEVGRELGSDYVLEGAIRWDNSRKPGRVRITPRLIRVADDTYLWSDNYEREVTEIFSLQAAIASRIAEALDVTLVAPVRQALDERPTRNIDAYKAYLQGLRQLNSPGFSPESFELGIRMFQRAVELDPDFALAHARLSSMHSRMYHYGFDRSDRRLEMAIAAAQRALEMQPRLTEARLAMGHYHYWGTRDFDQALTELEIARASEPNNSDVGLAMAYVKRRQGEFEDALELLERDQELSPLDPNVAVALGETYGTVRRYEEAQQWLRRAIALAPDDPYPYTELALLHLRWRANTAAARDVLARMPPVENQESCRVRFLVELLDHRYDQALERLSACPGEAFEAGAFYTPVTLFEGMVHRLRSEPGLASAAFDSSRTLLEPRLAEDALDPRFHASLGLTYAAIGRAEDAVRHARRAVELLPLERDALSAPVLRVDLALVHTMVGDAEAALEQLRRVLAMPSTLSVAWLEADPRWDPLRSHPRYAALLRDFRPSN